MIFAAERAHVLHFLLAAHGVNHRAGPEEQQRLEEGVGEDVEDAGRECAYAERQKHVSQLRDRGVRQHALDVVLHQGDGRGEDRGQRADDGDRLHRIGRQHEQRVGARHHVHARGHHGRSVDQRGDRRRAFHRVRQPDIQRELRRLAAGADEQQQAGGGDHRIANVKLSAARQQVDLGVLHRAEVPGDGEHAQDESGVTDTVHDECLVGGGRGGVALEVEADQQVRAQAHALPAHEHHGVVVGQDQRQHGEHEQVHVAEEAVVAAFMPHVADRVNVDQHAHAGHEQQPDAGQRIEQEAGIGAELGGAAAMRHIAERVLPVPIQVYSTFSKGLPGLAAL